MAISFSRPDPSSPAAVADANFPTSRRGFDQQEVREFLRMVAAELARSQEREHFLENELRTRRQQNQASNLPTELDDDTVARMLGEEATRILQAARESASATRAKADEAIDRLFREAKEEAQRVREDAELEANRRRKDAELTAEAELEAAKSQGKEMVDEAREYRERALGELARRRDLARQQIDQLIHGRERVVQAFERARLAAADVVAELAPLGELDEYVNLSPTTGPVPVMLPASRLADASAISDDALVAFAPPVRDDDVTTPAARPDVEPELEAAAAETVEAKTGEAETVESDAVESAAAEAVGAAPAEPESFGRNATVLQFPTAVETVEIVETELADGELIDDDDVTASDVDDLFARLRAQRPADRDESNAPDRVTASGDDVAVDTADDMTDDTGDDAEPSGFEQREEALTPLIVAAARKLKRVLADEQNTALEVLRGPNPVTALDQLVHTESEHVERYFSAVVSDVLAAAQAGADTVGGHVITTGEVDAVRAALAVNLVGPLRDRLGDRIASGEGDNEAVTRSARAVYREWKTKHIDDELDDLLRLAYERGVVAALPEGSRCSWTVDPSVGGCSDCDDNTLQGSVIAGSAFPTGHFTPPAHPGCRCHIQPTPS